MACLWTRACQLRQVSHISSYGILTNWVTLSVMTTHYGIGMQTDSSELSLVKWRWLMCLEIICLSRITVLSLIAGPGIVKRVIFLLPTILFASNLTKRSFSTHSFENLSCKSYNVVYAIECAHCGLIYVGETKGEIHGNLILQKHFFAFSCPPQLRRRTKLFMSCCRP